MGAEESRPVGPYHHFVVLPREAEHEAAVRREPREEQQPSKVASSASWEGSNHESGGHQRKWPTGLPQNERLERNEHGRKHKKKAKLSHQPPPGNHDPVFEVGQRVMLRCRPVPARRGIVISKGVAACGSTLYGVHLDKGVVGVRHVYPWQLEALEDPPSAREQIPLSP